MGTKHSNIDARKNVRLLCISLAMIFIGNIGAMLLQTIGGTPIRCTMASNRLHVLPIFLYLLFLKLSEGKRVYAF